ncbi:MAG: hypothetical protein HQ567_28750 [Candidatus Nealsonbacteria bacterium]|nr:hypothetical protein [Candidatus Nealsonbacteria bacterium]
MIHPRFRKFTAAVFCAVLAAALSVATAQEKAAEKAEETKGTKKAEQKPSFLRLARIGEKAPTALEVAIVRLRPTDKSKKGPVVDLIGAVHVAEQSYYRQLNKEFEKYDVVLYELVAPEGTRVPKGGGGGSGSPVSALQGGMKNMLELSFQLEEIDYTRKNMVHADMSPEQFSEKMRERGESVLSMFLRMMGYALAKQNKAGGGSSDMQLLMALFDKNRALALKRVMAEQMEDMEGMLSGLEGPDGSTIISERNKVALEVLRKQIAAGKQKIAIFYGAGHMLDFQKRLADQFGMAPVNTRWLVAWNLKDPKKPAKKDDRKP